MRQCFVYRDIGYSHPMISGTSLSAFSAGVGQTQAGRVSGQTPVQQARAQQAAPAPSAASPSSLRTSPQSPAPGQTLPRRSLLDIAV
jgi:hypothetical protein